MLAYWPTSARSRQTSAKWWRRSTCLIVRAEVTPQRVAGIGRVHDHAAGAQDFRGAAHEARLRVGGMNGEELGHDTAILNDESVRIHLASKVVTTVWHARPGRLRQHYGERVACWCRPHSGSLPSSSRFRSVRLRANAAQ
jgi:hypothetical protein